MQHRLVIAAYLGAIVTANLVIAAIGPPAVPAVAFVLVGFVITSRDWLHDSWAGRGLAPRMGALIVAGGALSALVNIDALPIAVASSVAFAASETVNALVYQPMLARGVPWLRRVNAGNVPNALVDSAVFVTLAFGWDARIVALQVVAKVAGGFLWSWAIARRQPEALEVLDPCDHDGDCAPPLCTYGR